MDGRMITDPMALARHPGDATILRAGPQLREYGAIADRIAEDGPGHILDWGCGFGYMMNALHGRGVRVSGLDYRPEVREEGTFPLARYPHLEAFVTREPITLPFPSATFDAVLSCGVLEHVLDPDASLDELRRVLSPGGVFYVYKLPNRYAYIERLAKWSGSLYYHGALPNDRVYTRRRAVELLQRHGFEIQEFRRRNVLPLSLVGPLATAATPAIWGLNRVLSRVPVLNLIATNLDVVATAPAR
ncbi:MAG: hypothetical protein QOJ09_990 [Actinomycetota bacterium]|jgi:SAM-dependent methyltransferase|nr:hypothetical protein [Actinomycetota bacterium]